MPRVHPTASEIRHSMNVLLVDAVARGMRDLALAYAVRVIAQHARQA